MRTVTPEEDLPIWQKETLFPAKPPSVPYGYLPYKGDAVGARNLEELKHAFSLEKEKIYGVWIPERERVIPVAEAPELLKEMQPKRIKESLSSLKSTRFTVLIFLGVLAFISFNAFQQVGWQFYKVSTVVMVAIAMVMFSLAPFYEAWKSHQTAKKLNTENLSEEAKEMRFEIWMSKQKAPFTKVLVFVLIGLSILQIMVGGAEGGGFRKTASTAGLINKSLLNGETWRLWTAPFLHGGPIHILFNASALWYLGKRAEVLAKWAHFLMVFISSALIGSYCSIHFLPILPDGTGQNGIGASGGIMGLLGFLLTFELLHPKLSPKPARRRLIVTIVLMYIIGFIGIGFIDNAAHTGGLVAGVLYALFTFSKSDSAKRPTLQTSDWIIGIGSLIIIVWSAFLTYSKIT